MMKVESINHTKRNITVQEYCDEIERKRNNNFFKSIYEYLFKNDNYKFLENLSKDLNFLIDRIKE